MKIKKLALCILAISMILAGSVVMADVNYNYDVFFEEFNDTYEYLDIVQSNMELGSGDISNATAFTGGPWRLHRDNGTIINFWIHNTGSTNIEIAINNNWGGGMTLRPGQQNHISATIPISLVGTNFSVQARPEQHGARITMSWRAAQRPF